MSAAKFTFSNFDVFILAMPQREAKNWVKAIKYIRTKIAIKLSDASML